MPHFIPRTFAARARSWVLTSVLAATVLAGAFTSGCGPVYVQDDAYASGYNAQAPVSATQVDFGYLSSYGVWTNTARFGNVWVPHANRTAGWRPYFYGQWDYTDYGWTWASDEAWGSGPYHYGRWAWDNVHRWVWIPGNVWGPAWVTWRSGGGCVGWAPLGPAGVVFNHFAYWTFVSQQHIYRRSVRTVIIPHTRVSGVYGQTVRIGHTGRIRGHGGRVVTYNAGPRRSTVQTWTRSPVTTTQVGSVRGASPRRRGPAAGAYRPAPGRQPTARPTYRPAVRPGYQPTTRPTGRPAYRPAPSPAYRPAPRPGSRPAYRPAPSQAYRPAPRAPTQYRPAPSATRPAYRPAPGRAAPSRAAPGRAAPGRVAPGYSRRANPYGSAPRASAPSRPATRPAARSSRKSSSSRSSTSRSSRRGTSPRATRPSRPTSRER